MQSCLILSLVAVGVLWAGAAWGGEIRAAAVDDFAAIQHNERTERTLRDFDAAAERTLASMDPATGLLRAPGLMDPKQFDWSIASLDRFERKRRITPEYSKYYRLGRGSASAIGVLGEAYALPLSRFHHAPGLLEAVRKGLAAFAAHQDPSGEWVFCPIRFSTVYGSHEMAWRLEPLLRAYACVQADLSPSDRERFRAMLVRASDFLLHTPCRDQCNRGVVWSGVMALCWAMLGQREYLDAARENWAHVAPVVFPADGQILEGPGPDLGYSSVSLRYAFLYRLMSGEAAADEALVRSLRWAMRLYDPNGLPFTGMSTRNDTDDSGRLEAYLPALEYYAGREPLFDRLAGDYLRCLERRAPGFAAQHGGAYALRAALFHGARPDASGAEPPEYFAVYQADVSIYVAVRRRYQTVINLRSRQPRNGLQMWTFGREKPVVCPTGDLGSGVETGDYASRNTDVRERGYGVWRSDLEALAAERGRHYEFYVFSPASTVVIYAGPPAPRITRWVLSKDRVADPIVEEGRVRFAGQDSALFFGGPAPRRRDERGACVLEFASSAGERDPSLDWFAFSGGPFRPEAFCEPVEGIAAFGFSDPSGAYLALANPSPARWIGRVRMTAPQARALDLELAGAEVRVLRLGTGGR